MAPAAGSYQPQHDEEVFHYNEAIEEAEKKAQRREAIRQENLTLCSNIMVFLLYIGIFTLAMFLESSDTSSRFADHIRAMLEGGGSEHHDKMVMVRIGNTDDVYSFLEQTFIPSLWANNTDTNQAHEISKSLHPIDVSNRMIGSARLRQVKVNSAGGCQVDPIFMEYMISCNPLFQPGGLFGGGNEATDEFGPDGVFKHSADPLGTGYSGSMGAYPSGGYMALLSTNQTTARNTIKMLKEENFLGLQTRAVFIDFTVWNSNLGVYAVCRVASEFGPTGTVTSYMEISILTEQMLKPGGHGTAKDWCAFFGVIIIMGFVIYFLAEEAQELYASKLTYFMDGWNVLDWINMLLLIVAFIERCMVYAEASGAQIGVAQLENPDKFSSVRGLASKAELVRLLHSFNAVLLWGKCVKYFKHLPIIKELVKTVWDAFSLFVPLMTMFIIALLGFTMAYNIGFGDKIQELTTFTRSIIYLSRAFIRDVKLIPVYYITPIFGAFLILLFYVMLCLVGVQVLFAVMADAMYREKHHKEGEDEMHRDEPLEELLRELKKLGVRLVRCTCPFLYRKFIRPLPSKEERDKAAAAAKEAAAGGGGGGGHDEKMALKDGAGADTATESSYSSLAPEGEKTFTIAEIMLAIQHMSGRVLSEVQEVGIEIRSELHDVCERVAQMQMAVEELSWRAELVRREQEAVL